MTGSSPFKPDAALCTNVRYLENDLKPSATTRILNEVFGSVDWGGLGLCHKRGFLEQASKQMTVLIARRRS